jgi:hypothetical protein
MLDEKKTLEDPLEPVPSRLGEVQEGSHDAVFGEMNGEGPNYRNVCYCCCFCCFPPFFLSSMANLFLLP